MRTRKGSRQKVFGPARCWLASFLAVFLAVLPAENATGQSTYRVGESVSVCIDPPQVVLTVRSESEKTYATSCRKWSQFTSTTAVVAVDAFKNDCTPSVPAANLFAGSIVSQWTGMQHKTLTGARLFDETAALGLRELGPAESRKDSLIVWKSGMVGVIVEDSHSAIDPRTSLGKLGVLYPSQEKCGALRVLNGVTLAKGFPDTDQFKLLKPRQSRLFWNEWIEGPGMESQLHHPSTDAAFYWYAIDLSALDYMSVLETDNPIREAVSAGEVAAVLPKFRRLKILVLPSGSAKLDGASSVELSVVVNEDLLRKSLTARSVTRHAKLSKFSEEYGALREPKGPSVESPVRIKFLVDTPGCGALNTVIWEEKDGLARLVGSWSRGFRSVNSDGSARSSAVEDDCGERTETARLLDPSTALPLALTAMQRPIDARLVFLDFGEVTVGSMEDLRQNAKLPVRWILEKRLSEHLPMVATKVDALSSDPETFEWEVASKLLAEYLFKCKPVGCDGEQALERLRQLADEQVSGAHVQIVFRDHKGSTNYIPIHLLPWKDRKLLAERITPVLSMPQPVAAIANRECIKTWSAGFIVSSIESTWREQWLSRLKETRNHDGNTYSLPEQFKNYLRDTRANSPEALMVLAHHSKGTIADSIDDRTNTTIDPDNVQRRFVPGSIAVLMVCSMGSLGGSDSDKPNSNSLLHVLNKNNIQAAIVSPFKVKEELAKDFLSRFREVVGSLEQDTPLEVVVSKTRALLKKDPNSAMSKHGADMFMLIGDGSVPICKPQVRTSPQ